ncbi:MAG: isoprenylcysteine carboxylmethyltransferase family protein [Gracilimonas sp.]|nr:isoprenylcysteine carboxylmethyltransferase family protein [Gracilimonas sp.]
MWAIHQFIPNQGVLFEAGKFIGIGLMILGGSIGVLAITEFARRSTTVNPHKPENAKELVTTGVYQYSRNPMYLGLLIALMAMILYWGNSISLLLLPGFIWYMNEFQIKPEEEIMGRNSRMNIWSIKRKSGAGSEFCSY